MNGQTLKSLANGTAKCKYCDHQIQADMVKKNPFELLYRVSKKHVPLNSETHLLIEDEEEEPDTRSIIRRMMDSFRGKS